MREIRWEPPFPSMWDQARVLLDNRRQFDLNRLDAAADWMCGYDAEYQTIVASWPREDRDAVDYLLDLDDRWYNIDPHQGGYEQGRDAALAAAMLAVEDAFGLYVDPAKLELVAG